MNAELTVRQTIREHGLINRGDRVVLGLSGGPDSLCLLHVLAELRESLGFELFALHLNHLMRGEAAEADVRFLEETCAGLSVPLKVVRCDVYKKAADEGISVEEAGRAARHRAIMELCEELGGARAAFAHNRDDQAETVLMRIFRGTGVHGLAAMEYEREDGVIRPLLDTPRSEIEAYCERHCLSPRFDSTNASLDYTRNRLRLELIPQLTEEYNPSLKDGLVRLSANAAEDDSCLEQLARDFIGSADIERGVAPSEVRSGDPGNGQAVHAYISIPRRQLKVLHPAVFKRVVRRLFLELGLTEDIASVHLNPLFRAVTRANNRAVIEFPHGFSAEAGGGKVTLRAPQSTITTQKLEDQHAYGG